MQPPLRTSRLPAAGMTEVTPGPPSASRNRRFDSHRMRSDESDLNATAGLSQQPESLWPLPGVSGPHNGACADRICRSGWPGAHVLAAVASSGQSSDSRPAQQRSFWALETLGFLLWASKSGRLGPCGRPRCIQQSIPDPFFFDIILFFHTRAVYRRRRLASRLGEDGREEFLLSLLNFLMLLGWWIFLYAFIVFPHQYVARDAHLYNLYYDRLYGLENVMLLAVLAACGLGPVRADGGGSTSISGAASLYGINSQLLDRALADNTYYSGSLYDVPLIGTVAWMAATAWSAADIGSGKPASSVLTRASKNSCPNSPCWRSSRCRCWGCGPCWRQFVRPRPGFRVSTVLAAMLGLGSVRVPPPIFPGPGANGPATESRRDTKARSVCRANWCKRRSWPPLGNLVAGAAHEIDHPLTAVMSYSEQLWAKERLTDEQNALVRKIVNQARALAISSRTC